jgi:hypothetical protein
LVYLAIPSESANLTGLKRNREDRGMKFLARPEMGHRVLPVKCTWDEFEKSRGKKFRQDFKRTERKMAGAGSWKVTCFEKGEAMEITNRILDVERVSWKEEWRSRMELEIDKVLMMVLRGSLYAAETEPDFMWNVWFLELDNKPLAYIIVVQYKGVAYFAKTSHDARYRRFSPGIYVMNAALRELFNGHQVKIIDFLTDLQWVGTWTSFCLPRVGILMPKSRVLTALISLGRCNRAIKSVLTSLSKRLPSIANVLY